MRISVLRLGIFYSLIIQMIFSFSSEVYAGNKKQLIKKNPGWKLYLEDPDKGIQTLIQNKNFQTLRAIIDVLEDDFFFHYLARRLGESYSDPDTQREMREILKGIIRQEKQENLRFIASETLSQP